MPSMMENVVMKKCKVKFSLARSIVYEARENMPKEGRNILWSKTLEDECLRIYYEQYGVKLGLTWPPSITSSTAPGSSNGIASRSGSNNGQPHADLGSSSHTTDTAHTFANYTLSNQRPAPILSRCVSAETDRPVESCATALKKSRSFGTNIIKSPSNTRTTTSDHKLDVSNTTTARSPRKSSLISKKSAPTHETAITSTPSSSSSSSSPSKSPYYNGSLLLSPTSRQRSTSGPRNAAAATAAQQAALGGLLDGSDDRGSSSKMWSSPILLAKDSNNNNKGGDVLNASDHSARSSTSTKSKTKKVKKTPSSLLDSDASGKREKSEKKKKRSLHENETAAVATPDHLLEVTKAPLSPRLSDYISSPKHVKSPLRSSFKDPKSSAFDPFATLPPPISPCLSDISSSPKHIKSPSLRLSTYGSGKGDRLVKNKGSFQETNDAAAGAADPFEPMESAISPVVSSPPNHGKSPGRRLRSESVKKERAAKNSQTFNENETVVAIPDPFDEPPMSPSLNEFISSSPTSRKAGTTTPKMRLTAGMHGLDDSAFSRDTTPYKPKVDKSPRKTPRKASLLLTSKQVPTGISVAEPAIRRAFENHQHHTNDAVDAAGSPTRIFIRCKRAKPKLRESTSMNDADDTDGGGFDDDKSYGPDDLLKRSPDRKLNGSSHGSHLHNSRYNADGNGSRYMDGNSSRTKMVPVVRQSSGTNRNRRGSNKAAATRSGSFKENADAAAAAAAVAGVTTTSPEAISRRSRHSTAPDAVLFHEGFLVSPSRMTSMDNFQRPGLNRQNSSDSFLSVESFSNASPFDSPVQTSLGVALPALPKLSPNERPTDHCCLTDLHNVVFDAETVSSSLAVSPEQPTRRRSSSKPRRFRGAVDASEDKGSRG